MQHVIALSATKTKYTAATEAVKKALWLKGLITKLGIKQEIVEVHCDSSSAIYLRKNPTHHEKTKHIDIKLHFIKNVISKSVIDHIGIMGLIAYYNMQYIDCIPVLMLRT